MTLLREDKIGIYLKLSTKTEYTDLLIQYFGLKIIYNTNVKPDGQVWNTNHENTSLHRWTDVGVWEVLREGLSTGQCLNDVNLSASQDTWK